MSGRYVVVAHPDARPAARALARRHERVEDAVAAMGTGVVLDETGRLVAFHELHLALIERRAG